MTASEASIKTVSYTHLDVYKRQLQLMFLSYTPQGMLLNPRRFPYVITDSVRLFRQNLPTALGLLAVVLLARQLLSYVLLLSLIHI